MALKVTAADGVKIYNLSSGKSLPEWVQDQKRKESKTTDQNIELLQDFAFPSACRKIEQSQSGDCLIAVGNYPPQVRIFDVANLSAKVTRHFDAEVIDFQILTEDYTKLVFLCSDRTLKFHARFGSYHETRIPLCGRAITYLPFLAHLIVTGSTSDISRLDLSEGRFLEPVETHMESINACDLCNVHGLLACAGSDGSLECIDMRRSLSVGTLDVSGALQRRDCETTAVKFDPSGMHLAVGMSDGSIGLFDIRSQKPMITKDHMYDAPIHTLQYLYTESGTNQSLQNKIASADRFVLKIWDTVSGETFTNIEPGTSAGINHFSWWKDSGLFFVASDDPKIQSYFIPSLGTAPSWCSFLEGLTEELEEEAGHSLYDDYKFVTKDELVEVGLAHLLGTDVLKAYMHGFFIHHKLYTRAKLMNQPPQETIPIEKLDARISSIKRFKGKQTETVKSGNMEDERFRAIYDDPAFQIDENRQPHDQDSLLVPYDSVPTKSQTSFKSDAFFEEDLPFESRTSKKKKKSIQSKNALEFEFVPKSKKKHPFRFKRQK